MQINRKACATNTGSKPKIYINAGANNKCFGISDSIENAQKIQCCKCNPPLSEPRGKAKLCPNCEAEQKQTAITFFDNFRRHRKIVRLDCWCYSCNQPKSSAMMSKSLPICRLCANEMKIKGATAQNNFVEKVKASVGRRLKAVVAL